MELEQKAAGIFRFDSERNIVELVWSEKDLSDDDVKEMLERFGAHAEAHAGANLLVDIRRFKYPWGPAMDAWRDATVIPVYNGAGVRKFAFLLPAGAPTPPTGRQGPAQFDTGYFDSREAAENWFAS